MSDPYRDLSALLAMKEAELSDLRDALAKARGTIVRLENRVRLMTAEINEDNRHAVVKNLVDQNNALTEERNKLQSELTRVTEQAKQFQRVLKQRPLETLATIGKEIVKFFGEKPGS